MNQVRPAELTKLLPFYQELGTSRRGLLMELSRAGLTVKEPMDRCLPWRLVTSDGRTGASFARLPYQVKNLSTSGGTAEKT